MKKLILMASLKARFYSNRRQAFIHGSNEGSIEEHRRVTSRQILETFGFKLASTARNKFPSI